ncbi:MAG: diguanylate cyclase, partial [Gammaproteobacteria bacterium]
MRKYRELLIFAVLTAFIGGLLAWDAEHEAERLREQTDRAMRRASDQLGNSLQPAIRRLHHLAKLFATDHTTLIDRVRENPTDPEAHQALLDKVQGYFPQFLAFTVADLDGRLLLPQSAARIGRGCRLDVSRHVRALRASPRPHVYSPHIHGNPAGTVPGYHFDVMVPWKNRHPGIFFVSIRSDFLAAVMRRHEGALYDLVLLDARDPRKVELTSANERPRDPAVALTGKAVPDTAWRTGAVLDTAAFARRVSSIRQRHLALFLALVPFLAVAVAMLRRERERNRTLHALNAQYQQEISYRRAAERRLAELARFDPITTLPNQATAREFLEQAISDAREQHRRPAVLFLDIDRFARINDSLGHQTGDALLTRLARRLREKMDPDDMLARWSGDEFLIVVRHASTRLALTHYAERLAQATERPFDLRGHRVVATVSIGIATWPEAGQTTDELIKNADHALQQAKSEGRNAWRFFLHEMNEEALRRISLETDFRRALIEGEFEPWYQPKYDLASESYCGAEVLMRWRHPTKGVLAPASFLELIEENGMIDTVGEQVRNQVCENVLAWQTQGLSIGQIAVNLGG